ncbi:MAG: glycosyltransferase [Verrucomicrobia bacterium]|nr:glycosyltransferase [Verrucomicrobiota bacterium]
MPQLSLVICLHGERAYLERLLPHAAGCHDDLVVVHDGPDTTGVREVVEAAGGRFFERPRAFEQEPHWPFAWAQARHDWILRLDADEFPGGELKRWLQQFRQMPEPPPEISGYTCIWPLWNGTRAVTRTWPNDRPFLFHKQRVRFFGMAEQTPIPDRRFEPLKLVLHHEPRRKSYGIHNILLRQQMHRWRAAISRKLLGSPAALPGWRWESETWPAGWEQIRRRPLWTACKRLTKGTLTGLRDQWRAERQFMPSVAFSGPVHHALICYQVWRLKQRAHRKKTS